MKKFLILSLFSVITTAGVATMATDRILTCAVKYIPQGYQGIRVNIISAQNKTKATVFEGTTRNSSGTYWVKRTARGFEGADRTGQRPFVLLLSDTPAENKYIRGVHAALQAAVIETSQGPKVLSTKRADGFVCGQKINPYGDD